MVSVAFAVSSLSMGGIERVTTTIANGLASRGFDVTLVNLSHRKEFFPVRTQRHLRPGWLSYNWWRIKRKISYVFCGDDHGYTWEPWIRSQFKKGKYDYIILNPDFFVFYDIVRQLHPESKILLWMHNNYDIYVDKYFKEQLKLLKHAVRESDGIICLESYSAQRWRQLNGNIHLIYNPLTLDDQGHRSSLLGKTIAATSRLVKEQKGLDYLLAVAESVPDGWQISLAGDGDDRGWLQSEIENKGLAGKLTLCGALDDDALDEHYANASIFLSTSRWEGFPLVAAEAMSRGLPFVSFDIPAMREVTDDGQYGFLVPLGDTTRMGEVLGELTDDADLRRRYSDLSLERVKDFSLDQVLNKWAELFNE
ncbi:glycosyltransferase [Bifidobacterium choerinum]|uniref:Glycosyl transferase group 1 n=1 Tax=Bifidobacterium choerinum TaxID=35760 RepID=A0A087ADY9_9BIFI|nr:glycosyltransferase [Bifidobacterium choerinum]KFI56989.1 glycosyl transferase group 1 [Bifidobacterium choerinum]